MLSVPQFHEKFRIPTVVVPDQYGVAGTTPGDGSVWPAEGLILAACAAHHGGPVLELGAARGVSTRFIIAGLRTKPVVTKVYSVDINHGWVANARDYPELIQVHDSSFDYFGPFQHFAFVDGDHEFESACKDIDTITRQECRFALFHDTAEWLQGPTPRPDGKVFGVLRACREYLPRKGWGFAEIDTQAGMVYAWRK